MKTVIVIVFGVLSTIFSGYAISVVWGWFVVPLGVNEIGIAHACGFASFISYLTYRKIDEEEDDWREMVTVWMLKPVLLIFVCWIFKSFM